MNRGTHVIILSNIALRYVMLCGVVLCQVVLCCVTLHVEQTVGFGHTSRAKYVDVT
jgi:hypothetical protein